MKNHTTILATAMLLAAGALMQGNAAAQTQKEKETEVVKAAELNEQQIMLYRAAEEKTVTDEKASMKLYETNLQPEPVTDPEAEKELKYMREKNRTLWLNDARMQNMNLDKRLNQINKQLAEIPKQLATAAVKERKIFDLNGEKDSIVQKKKELAKYINELENEK